MTKKMTLITMLASMLMLPSVYAQVSSSPGYRMEVCNIPSGGGEISSPGYIMQNLVIGSPVGGKSTSAGYIMSMGYMYIITEKTKNSAPVITEIAPQENYSCEAGDSVPISVTAYDPDGDDWVCQIIVDTSIEKDWSSIASCQWQTDEDDNGDRVITVKVTDGRQGHNVENEVNIHVFRKPIYPQE